MLTYINCPRTDRSEGRPKATCESPQCLLTVSPTAPGLGRRYINPIAPSPRPDLDDTYGSQFNPWQFLPASVAKTQQKPDWTLTARAARSQLPLLQGEQDRPTILRIFGLTLKGVQS
jgi:hypothetical protein